MMIVIVEDRGITVRENLDRKAAASAERIERRLGHSGWNGPRVLPISEVILATNRALGLLAAGIHQGLTTVVVSANWTFRLTLGTDARMAVAATAFGCLTCDTGSAPGAAGRIFEAGLANILGIAATVRTTGGGTAAGAVDALLPILTSAAVALRNTGLRCRAHFELGGAGEAAGLAVGTSCCAMHRGRTVRLTADAIDAETGRTLVIAGAALARIVVAFAGVVSGVAIG
jgi:hypothetical protein